VPAVDQQVTLVQGALEASNVDAVSELVQSIEAQRQFEMGVKFIKMAEDIDRGGAELMRLPQG
jgi:flagellar basal-body rod protein FlgF